MVHWYPPRRETGNETSKRLQTSRRSKNNLTSPTTKVKHVQIHGRRVADRVESEHRANPYRTRTDERTNTGIYRRHPPSTRLAAAGKRVARHPPSTRLAAAGRARATSATNQSKSKCAKKIQHGAAREVLPQVIAGASGRPHFATWPEREWAVARASRDALDGVMVDGRKFYSMHE
jgi:hypothetical protein